ncbi:MAG TPA: sigma-70 family RNA polymerase sigma factor [Pseudonocardia sp.]|nr:sigma-70 family RNA polymerase sigma factor [Pseudonocardia sp.]
MTRSDAELLRAHLAGDRAAYPELFRRYQSFLWTIAYNELRNREDAAEAVQDTLMRAYQAADRCTSDGSIRGWLVKILLNICRDQFRRSRGRPSEAWPGEALDEVPMPRNPIADHEMRMDILAALAQLPPQLGQVLLMVDLAGWPLSEVAEALGVAVGTVKSRGWRARKGLFEVYRATQPALQVATEDR